MITLFGRYMWKRLPFGLKVSSVIFQRKIDEALGDLDGVFNIVDDVVIVGCGNSDAEAQSDNQQKLAVTLKRCAEKNIILNEDKQETGLDEIIFHGHRITKDGVKVDEAKVQAIRDMPAPTDVEGVKRLCGMAQYMAKFLHNLAATLEPIRALTRKDTPFVWSKECEDAFNILKKNLSESPCLAYFDSSKEVVIQADSSKHGIGAVLLQEGRPIEYASRALTPSERNWAQIEKEALAVLYGLERFDQYAYGRAVIKTYKDGGDPYEAILEQRNTPRQDTALSPAEMMFNCKTRSFLPSLSSKPKNTLVKGKRDARKRSVKTYHDRKSRKLSVIEIGQSVFYQHTEGQNWKWGKVTGILGPNTYQVEGANGGKYRRNRVHLRPTKVVRTPRDVSPIVLSRTPDQVLTSAVPAVPQTPTTGAEAKESHSHSEATTPIKSPAPERPKRESRLPIHFKDYVLNK